MNPDLDIVLCGDGSLARLLPEGKSQVSVSNQEGPHCGVVPLGKPAHITSKGLKWDMGKLQFSPLLPDFLYGVLFVDLGFLNSWPLNQRKVTGALQICLTFLLLPSVQKSITGLHRKLSQWSRRCQFCRSSNSKWEEGQHHSFYFNPPSITCSATYTDNPSLKRYNEA